MEISGYFQWIHYTYPIRVQWDLRAIHVFGLVITVYKRTDQWKSIEKNGKKDRTENEDVKLYFISKKIPQQLQKSAIFL